MTEFQSDLITLNDVIEQQYFFNIPIYQRLYVWGGEQIKTLLEDIVQAYEEGKNEFYLGGTLVIERDSCEVINDKHTFIFDLIDGQQRFTTLWLISVVLGESLSEYRQVQTEEGVRPRIGFSIRPQVTDFFERLSRCEPASLPEARQLEDALDEIRSFVSNYKSNKKQDDGAQVLDVVALSDFIRNKVQLILTRVPKNTDLNKLFEVINNRGIQLQHHEILKAKLLEFLPREKRDGYSYVWDACSDMEGYVERNLRQATKTNTVDLFTQEDLGVERLAKSNYVLEALNEIQQQQTVNELSLAEILNEPETFKKDESEPNEKELTGLPDRVSSIITFSMLLQHVLRIYLSNSDKYESKDIAKVSDKDLLNIFNTHWLGCSVKLESEDIESFIGLLWEARYQFDKHVIKWVLVEEEKIHSIRRLYVNNSKDNAYLQRSSQGSTPDFALLQSMLYHSQQMTTQYWLTPLLNFLLENNDENAELYLKHLDNNLLCSEADASLIERTHRYLVDAWHTEPVLDAKISLNQTYSNGTQYPHYWFYKLEYILYLKLKGEGSKLVDDFRVTAKNSVEHVTPQNPRIKKEAIPDNLLHTFGNLALVTGSINSEMTDDGFTIKKAKFQERHKGKGVSLKLEDIYENTQWKEDEIETHHRKMIEDFNLYIGTVSTKKKDLLNV
jgi:hypothetical protein